MYDSGIESLYRKIGQKIVAERKRKGISQEKLAADTGIDRSHIGYIEQNRRKPTLATLYKICRGLDIRLSDLIKGF